MIVDNLLMRFPEFGLIDGLWDQEDTSLFVQWKAKCQMFPPPTKCCNANRKNGIIDPMELSPFLWFLHDAFYYRPVRATEETMKMKYLCLYFFQENNSP